MRIPSHFVNYGCVLIFSISFRFLVRAAGFEPATPCSQSRCATRLRHTRIFFIALYELVPRVRIERTTYRLQGGCSTS